MRLLWSNASEKLSFTQFKASAPPYAILSHTWEKNNDKEKTGYRKIKFCASQVKQDNIQYFWDVEHSKAIKSMFHWYQNATKCYVILSDVSVPDPTDIARPSAWESCFKANRWFTRGWTLQEIIGPSAITCSSTGQT
ncbi:hypothetical protein V8F06_010606 [Rhypophila decipiens]